MSIGRVVRSSSPCILRDFFRKAAIEAGIEAGIKAGIAERV